MQLNAERASASEAGGEMFQIVFEANPEQEDGPYVLIQRAWRSHLLGLRFFTLVQIMVSRMRLQKKVDALRSEKETDSETARAQLEARKEELKQLKSGDVFEL